MIKAKCGLGPYLLLMVVEHCLKIISRMLRRNCFSIEISILIYERLKLSLDSLQNDIRSLQLKILLSKDCWIT